MNILIGMIMKRYFFKLKSKHIAITKGRNGWFEMVKINLTT